MSNFRNQCTGLEKTWEPKRTDRGTPCKHNHHEGQREREPNMIPVQCLVRGPVASASILTSSSSGILDCLCAYIIHVDKGIFWLIAIVWGGSCYQVILSIFIFDHLAPSCWRCTDTDWLIPTTCILWGTVSAWYICKPVVWMYFLVGFNRCVCPHPVTMSLSKLPVVFFVRVVQSSYSHYVVHLPSLSGFTGVTVWYEHFVE